MNLDSAVVTGAASGIGRSLAVRLAAAGASLLLADVDVSGLTRLADDLGARAMVVDVSRPDHMDALAAAAPDASLVCLNAGIVGPTSGPPWTVPDEEWRRVFDVNVGGVVNGLRAFVPHLLRASSERHLLITASLAGVITFPTGGAYAASKHAVAAVAEQTAMALEGTPVSVTMICPALVRTGMSPVGGDPDDVAAAAIEAVTAGTFAQVPATWHAAPADRAIRLANGLPPVPPATS